MSTVSSKSIDAAVRVGHVHLKVANLERAIGFYHGVLGFEVVLQYGGEGAFFSGGGLSSSYRVKHLGKRGWSGSSSRHDRAVSRRVPLSHPRTARGCAQSIDEGKD